MNKTERTVVEQIVRKFYHDLPGRRISRTMIISAIEKELGSLEISGADRYGPMKTLQEFRDFVGNVISGNISVK